MHRGPYLATFVILLVFTASLPAMGAPFGPRAVDVDLGGDHTCVLTDRGNVDCWGEGLSGQGVGLRSGNVTDIALMRSQTCYVFNDGNIDCTFTGGFTHQGGDAVSADAGPFHICWVTTSGNVDCRDATFPTQSLYSGGDAVSVSSGFNADCVVTSTNDAQCWGSIALTRNTGDVVSVSADGDVCLLLTSGDVDCQNMADYTLGDAVSLAVGGAFVCVVDGGADVVCWGDNRSGQTIGYQGGDAVKVAAGQNHACALLVDGSVICWGDPAFGQNAPYRNTGADPAEYDPSDPGGVPDASNDPSSPTPLRPGETRGRGNLAPLLDPIDAYSFVVPSNGTSPSHLAMRVESLHLIDIRLTLIDPSGTMYVVDSAGASGTEVYTTSTASAGAWRAIIEISPGAGAPNLGNFAAQPQFDTYEFNLDCTPFCP